MSALDINFKEIFIKYISQICKNKDRILIIVSHNIDLYKDLNTHILEMDNSLNFEMRAVKQQI